MLVILLQERHGRTADGPENEIKILNRIKGNAITLGETNLSRALLVWAQ